MACVHPESALLRLKNDKLFLGSRHLVQKIRKTHSLRLQSSICHSFDVTCGRHEKQSPLQKAGVAFTAITLAAMEALSPLSFNGQVSMTPPPAEAVLFSPDTAKLPKSGDVALRRSIPALNPSLKGIQSNLEEIFFYLRIPQRKPYGTMASKIDNSIQLVKSNRSSILLSFPESSRANGEQLLNNLVSGGKNSLEGLAEAVEQKDSDKVAIRLVNTLEEVAGIMELQAPGLPYFISSQYSDLPRLTGRATVAFTVSKTNGTLFSVPNEQGSRDSAQIEIVLDGYSAPLTAGNFADLVAKGEYNGAVLQAANQAILSSTAKPLGRQDLPLEIMPSGDEAPVYRTPLDVQDGEIPVIPMSVYGSVAMAHGADSETSSNASQFFVYLYDKRNSGLGGLSFEEGQFSVFGYVTKGKDVLAELKTGDVISSAELTSGRDRLVVPK